MKRTLEQHLNLVIPRICKKIIESVGEGNISDVAILNQPFHSTLSQEAYKLNHNYNIKMNILDILRICKKYMVAQAVKNNNMSEEEAENYYSRFFDYKRPKREDSLTLEDITNDVIKYLKNGGTLKNKAVKSFPFYERFRTLIKHNEEYRGMEFIDLLDKVREYYFKEMYPHIPQDQRLTEGHFVYQKVQPIYYVNLDVLANDVISFIKQGGIIDEETPSSLPFYRRFLTYIEQDPKRKETLDFYSLLEKVKEHYFANVYPITPQEERLEETDFYASVKRVKEINMDVLANDVANYVLCGGKLIDINTKVRDLPFNGRVRNYLQKLRSEGRDIDYATLMEEIIEHYFTHIAPSLEENDRLTREDLKIEEYHKYINKMRAKVLRKIVAGLKDCADSKGCIDSLYEEKNELLLSTIKNFNVDFSMTPFEFVALLLPSDCPYYLSTGFVNTEYIGDVEKRLMDFVREYGVNDIRNNIHKHNPNLELKLTHLARYFPEGSCSISNVLEFFGVYSKENIGDTKIINSINEDKIIEYVRRKYEKAIDEYVKKNGNVNFINMEEICSMMNIAEDPIYESLKILSVKYDMTLIDYLNGKEILPYDYTIGENGKVLSTRKRINGNLVPSFEYVIGIVIPRLSKIKVKNGKDLTFYLRNKMKEEMEKNPIINGEEYTNDEKLEEYISIAMNLINYRIGHNINFDNQKNKI